MAESSAPGDRFTRSADQDRTRPPVEILRTVEEIGAVQAEWEEFLEHHAADHSVREQPAFMLHHLKLDSGETTSFVVILRERGVIQCIAPFFPLHRKIPVQFGPFELPTRRVRFLRLFGDELVHRNGSSVPDNLRQLFQALQPYSGEFQAIWMPELEVAGDLWTFFDGGSSIREGHRLITLNPTREVVQVINLPGSFDEYLGGFKSRVRSDFRRQLKKLDKGCNGGAKLTKFTRPDQVSEFFALANEIRNNSWKAEEFGLNRYGEAWVRALEADAEKGWVRGYILRCGDVPAAYGFGYREGDTFVVKEWGYREEFRSLSPGMGMVLNMLRDLCEAGGCRVLLGPTDNMMKRNLGNATFEIQHSVIVPNASLRSRLRFGWHHFVAVQHKRASNFVKKLQAMRRKSDQPAEA